MWGIWERDQNHPGEQKCTDVWRDDQATREPCPTCQRGDAYFDEAWDGRHCATNWYEGDEGTHGNFWGIEDAPALLGLDDDIDWFCQGGRPWPDCDDAGVNILRLLGGVPYNTCRNFEWQLCAAKGLLNKQSSGTIRFATAPKAMDIDGDPPLWRCSGFTNRPCDHDEGFANECAKPPST